VGHTVTHRPQPVHFSWSISSPQPWRTMASAGQAPEHRPHCPQSWRVTIIF